MYPAISVMKDFVRQILRLHTENIGAENVIPAGNEPSGHACMHIWRLPRGSTTPLLAAGLLTWIIFELFIEGNDL